MQEIQTNEKFLTANQLAVRYQTKPLQIYEWSKNGTIPKSAIVRVGRKMLFDSEIIRDWENAGGTREQKQKVEEILRDRKAKKNR